MVCYGRAWPNLQPIAMVDPCGVSVICKGSLHALPPAALAVDAFMPTHGTAHGEKGTQEHPPKQERAPRRRFGQLGWRLGGREGALGPRALEFKTAMQASGMRHGRGWLDAGALCSAALALLCNGRRCQAPKASCTCLDQLRVDPLPKETLCTASKEEGSWADDGACVPAAEMPVGSMEYATPAAGSTLAIKRYGPTCQVKQGHLVTSERQLTSSHLLQPQST